MKRSALFVIFFILFVFSVPSFAACNGKPDYIPASYNVFSCGVYTGVYLESYVVKDNNSNKYGAYTYLNEPDSQNSKYNKMIAPVVYDDIIPVENGFIVKMNGKYGYIHIDKGFLFNVIYDKIYLSDDNKKIYAVSGTEIIKKDNPERLSDKVDKIMFNIFIRPLFFWLDAALPSR